MSQLITLEGDRQTNNYEVLEIHGDFLNQNDLGDYVEGDFFPDKLLVIDKNDLNGDPYLIDISGKKFYPV
ncbi:MAG TPA: hypothetical protein PK079_21635 [Leptospiraceae bacterium]|nr:hypothetical protein [Leptospiraceae bacterium]HMW08101.1 hypothetical protein [Leptospiraceae bacterium]HMY33812.1 hypothetical protein [Leptospiraceae bacterium]HMZ65923.1 hypothetical protein [Leptospiraceae bacterium]HNA08855.1 hypothetical protein [Leptospiraceae bacterium]